MLRDAIAQPLEPAMCVIGPRLDPGVHAAESFLQRNQIPYDRLAPDDPAAVARIGGGAAVAGPYPVVAATRRHSAGRADHARYCHGRWTDGRAKPSTLRRGDRRRRAGGSDGGGQRRLRGPADRADRVLRPGRAGRHLDPDRELHRIPIRHLRRRSREPCAATGEAAGRRDRCDPSGRQHRPCRADRHAGWRRRSTSEVDRPRDGRGVATHRDRFAGSIPSAPVCTTARRAATPVWRTETTCI